MSENIRVAVGFECGLRDGCAALIGAVRRDWWRWLQTIELERGSSAACCDTMTKIVSHVSM